MKWYIRLAYLYCEPFMQVVPIQGSSNIVCIAILLKELLLLGSLFLK